MTNISQDILVELNREIALLEKDIELMRKILEYNSDLVMVDCKDGLRADDEHIKAYEAIRANLIAYKNLIIRGVISND